MEDNKFSFFAPAFLVQENSNLRKGGKGKKIYKVGGVITTEDRDADGEILLTKGLDFSYFNGGWGKIKFEHDNEVMKEPDNIIGFPTKLIKKSTGAAFEGELIGFDPEAPEGSLTPQQRSAKSAVGLLEAIEEHNAAHPEAQQKVGWSIEGEYLQRDKKTGIVSKARIVNVVLTTKPRNTTTVATLIKSLSVGHAISPETQTGFGATRKESLEGNTKNQFSKKESNKMTFKSIEEAKKYFLSQGLSEEAAAAKAAEAMKEGEGKEEAAEKSVVATLKKSIEFANSVTEIQPDINADSLGEKLQKSISTMNDGGNIDISDYFVAKQETDLSVLEATTAVVEKQDLLAKSMSALVEGLIGIVGENEQMKKSLAFITESQKLNTQALLKSLKSKADFTYAPSDELHKVEIVDNDSAPEGDVDLSKMHKSVVANALFDLYKEGKVSDRAVTAYEGVGHIDERNIPLVKAKIATMKK